MSDEQNVTPEQQAMLAQMTELTKKLSDLLNEGQPPLVVVIGAAINVLGRCLQIANEEGDEETLMRAALALDNLAKLTAAKVNDSKVKH